MSNLNIDGANEHLVSRDRVLANLILKKPIESISLRVNYFESLTRSIIGQQLSAMAAKTITTRFSNLLGNKITPSKVLNTTLEDCRLIGISKQKYSYIHSLAEYINDNPSFFQGLTTLANEDIKSQLINFKGIGSWTSDMFLIFSMGRLDVIPFEDVGFQRGIQLAYDLNEKPTKSEILKYSERWHPFSGIAALYLWRNLDEN